MWFAVRTARRREPTLLAADSTGRCNWPMQPHGRVRTRHRTQINGTTSVNAFPLSNWLMLLMVVSQIVCIASSVKNA